MNRRPLRIRRLTAALLLCASGARADGPNPADDPAGRHKIIPHQKVDRTPGGTSAGSGGWWGGPVLTATALGILGAASLAARKYLPGKSAEAAPLKVLGRVSLGPRHAVHLLKAGDRVWLIGTGPQGAPSLLGELDEADDEPEPSRAVRPSVAETPPAPRMPIRVPARAGGAS